MENRNEHDDAYLETGDAANDLAQAFATIEKYKDMIPTKYYDQIAIGLADWISDTYWLNNQAAMREALPSILSVAISQKAASEVTAV